MARFLGMFCGATAAALLLLVSACVEAIAGGAAGSGIIDDVSRAWRKREERFRCGKIVIEEVRLVPKGGLNEIRAIRPEVRSQGPIPPKDTVQKCRRTLMFEAEKLRYSEDEPVWSLPDMRFESNYRDHLWDGKVGKSLEEEAPEDTFDYVGHLWPNARMITSMARLRPVLAHYRPSHGALDQLGRYSFTGRRGEIDMSSCIVLEASVGADAISGVKRSIWLDPERDFIVRRWMSELQGRTLRKTDLFYSEHPAHGWLPSRWEDLEHGKEGALRNSIEATVVDQALNIEVKPEDFRLEFPPGTLVTDHAVTTAKDQDFLIRPDGTRRLVVPAEMERRPTIEELFATEPGQAGLPRLSSRWVLVGVALLLLALFAGCAWAVRLWRRSTAR